MNILEALRRTLGADVYKKTAEGNPVSVRSLARMRPGLSIYGKSHQNTVAGNQLFDAGKEKLSYSADDSLGLTTTYDPETGWFHTTGTLTGSRPTYWREENLFNMKSGVQYYFSVETVGENDYIALAESGLRNAFLQKNVSFIQHVDTNANQIYSNHSYEMGTEFDLKFRIMISMGSTALPWEPYTGGKPSPSPDYPQEIHSAGDSGTINITLSDGGSQSQTLPVSTPNGLPGIPVSSGGNYTDENGQQWICDEIDFKRGKYVQRVELLRITDFSKTSKPLHTDLGNTECNIQIFGHYPDVQNMSHVGRSMCDSFIYSSIGDFARFAIGSDTELTVYFTLNGVLSREEYIAKMEEISPTILFPLATPIETDLTEEQMAAYANMHTNRPTTVVSATDGAGIKLTYKTKKSLEVTE